MFRSFRAFIKIQCLLLLTCTVQLSVGQSEKFLDGFIAFLNNLPNQPYYYYEDGLLLNSHKTGDNTYNIEVSLKVSELKDPKSFKLLKCTATIHDEGDGGITVQENGYQCHEDIVVPQIEKEVTDSEQGVGTEEPVTDDPIQEVPVKLDNEVQSETAVTSGEQFVAIPRHSPNAPCIGCSSHVNPAAPGVNELALLGVRHLDRHETNVRHSLNNVIDVERQVQVVNGVRYILTLNIHFSNCTTLDIQGCSDNKTCKISILEKPWVKLPDSSKFRAILANNCTEEWNFGDEGEVIADKIDEAHEDEDLNPNSKIKAVHQTEIQAQPNVERTLSDYEMKQLEEQIIPNKLDPAQEEDFEATTQAFEDKVLEKNAVQNEVIQSVGGNTILQEKVSKVDANDKTNGHLSEDKKKAINDLVNFFNYAGFDDNLKQDNSEKNRIKRSYDYDLKLLSLYEKFSSIKRKLNDAINVYTLGEILVHYLNEIDMEVKSRVLKEVVMAEEEFENQHQHYVYLQARIFIPCDKPDCDSNTNVTKICNAVIDNTDTSFPQVLNHFCYPEANKLIRKTKIAGVPLDDPILQKLSEKSLLKIETESTSPNAMVIKNIKDASTQKGSGTITKLALEIVYTNCSKSVPFYRRVNCTVLDTLGKKICEVIVHDRPWLNEKKLTYTCTEQSPDEKISPKAISSTERNINDPKIVEMVQDALQYLEMKSNRNNKQKVVHISEVTTKFIAGLLTDIKFSVGYTTCKNELDVNQNMCELLKGVPLRNCQAQIWDRSWLEDGKQVNVTCDDIASENNNIDENIISRKKRSIDSTSTEINQDKSAKVSDSQKNSKRPDIMVGRPLPQNKDDHKYKQLAEESMHKYLQESGNTASHKLVSVDHVTVQVVSGTMTRINFTISPVNGQEGDKINCFAKVWDQPWTNKKEITVNCQLNDRYKRELPGGEQEQNPNDPIYQTLALESMQKYKQESGNIVSHKLVSVDHVTTQVVSGSITRINFTISPVNDQEGDKINCFSSVWDQPWTNKKEITVNCQLDDRVKRQLPGGEKEQNPKDPKYQNMALESMQKYLKESGNTVSHKLVSVDHVTTQIVSGTITRINFTISPENSQEGDKINCFSNVWDQPWTNKKEITVNCQLDDRVKRQLPGGEKEENPKDPKYQNMALESMQKYLKESGNTVSHKLVSVNLVTTQIVSGTITRINFTISPENGQEGDKINCFSNVWDQPWTNKKEITVNCQLDDRLKRQLPGGEKEENPKDPKYQNMALESMQKYLKESGNTVSHKLVSVDHVTTQVVSGSITRINFTISPVNDQEGDKINCFSSVWDQPWTNKKEITVNCQLDDRVKRQLPGGEKEQNPKDPKYQNMALESMQKYLKESGNTVSHKLVSVDHVTTQVVSGSITRINFTISPVNDQEGDKINCFSSVWDQPWTNKKEITVNCQLDDRVKRQLPGGEKEQNPKDPKYQNMALESMQKYLKESGNTVSHKLVSVDHVTTQIVSGTITRINFTISPENGQEGDRINCFSNVWDQPWTNKKEITVNCQLDDRVKRQLPGGEKEENPKDPKYQNMALESMQKYLKESGNTVSHKLVSVDHVTTQIVSGTITRINFTISPENGQEGDRINCFSNVWDQPWTNKKEITVNCQLDDRVKRQLPGGEKEENPKDPKYQNMALESMQKYLKESGNTVSHKLVSVDHVTTQVVSGSITRINFTISPVNDQEGDKINCFSSIWDQPWTNKKEITVNCQLDDRVKRQLPGGEKEENPKDPKYQNMALESMQKYLKESGNTVSHKLVSVDHVTTQIVSGTITRINFTISPEIGQEGDKIDCFSNVWDQPWTNKKEITVNCQLDDRVKRQLPGGEKEENPKDPKYQNMALESMQKYLKESGNTVSHKLVSVDHVTTQVVSGSITRINFTISPVNDQEGDKINCFSSIWDQPWTNKKEITVNCQLDDRVKRQLPGGEKEQNPKDPKYQNMALESMQKYLKESGNTVSHKLVSVDHVTTQIVSGTITRINFTISPEIGQEGDKIDCFSNVWDQPWTNKKEITVNCQLDDRVKRQLPGGEKEENPKDPKYQNMALESMQKYLKESGNTVSHKLVSVDHVTTQIVSGTITRINFTISPENGQEGDKINCFSNVWDQPWTNKKEITVNCQLDDRVKRQLKGGEKEQNPKDPKYQNMALESMQKYLQESGNIVSHKLVSVDHVTTQVVSGSITRLNFTISPANGQGDEINCFSKVWDQPWTNKKEITVNCQLNYRVKRRSLGGEKEENPNDPKYQNLALESMQKYLQKSGNTVSHKLVSVDHVTIQIVSGTITRINFTISPVNDQDGDKIYCFSSVWDQPWTNKKEITVNCQLDDRFKRELPGGEQEQNPNDPMYQTLALESMQKYLQESGNTVSHKVVSVDHVTTQVVSGSITRINFTISPVNGQEGDKINCFAKVWNQPWTNKKEITVNCQLNDKLERQVLGGEQEQDPNGFKYRILTMESMEKYLLESGFTVPHNLVSVDHVTTQLLSGTITRINFTICPENGEERDKIKCFAEVWNQPWKNKKKITVNCKLSDKVKRGLLSVEKEQNPNDPRYQNLALESLQKYLHETGNILTLELVSVDRVTTQVLVRNITRIYFTVSPVNGPIGDEISCFSKVLDNEEITVTCKLNNTQIREMPSEAVSGEEKDPKDPKYVLLALASMHRYLVNTGIVKKHNLVSVDNVTVKTVGGVVIYIDFKITPDGEPDSNIPISCHSEIWDRLWTDEMDFEVNCSLDSGIATLLGPQRKNPQDSVYQKLALEAMEKYLLESKIKVNHKLVSVDRVTYQYVAGKMINIDFTITPVNAKDGGEVLCFSKVWDRQYINKKFMSVKCQENNQVNYKLLLGSQKEQNTNDAKYRTLALESMQKYLQESGNTVDHKLVSVDHVTTQVLSATLRRINFLDKPLSGSIIRINFTISPSLEGNKKTCYCEVWKQPWIKKQKKEIKVNCQHINRVKRHLVGDEQEENPNDPKYQTLAMESLQKFLNLSKNPDRHEVVSVDHVHSSQDVSGAFIHMNFTIAQVNGEIYDRIECCSKVREQSSIQEKEITVECHIGLRRKRSIHSGSQKQHLVNSELDNLILKHDIHAFSDLHEQDPSDKYHRRLAEETLRRYQILHGMKYAHKITKIEKVLRQVVEGVHYQIDYSAFPTVCLTKDVPNSIATDDCEPQHPNLLLKCHGEVWERPWLEDGTETNVTCFIEHDHLPIEDDTRFKRQLRPDDYEVEEDTKFYYAERAIQELNEHSDTNNMHKLVTIYDVHTSMIMGPMVIRMYIEAAYTFCLKQDTGYDLNDCEEIEGLSHRLCLAKITPAPEDELIIKSVSVVCDDDKDFGRITGVSVMQLITASIKQIEKSDDVNYKLVHEGEPSIVPTLDINEPFKLIFIVRATNCSKKIEKVIFEGEVPEPKHTPCFVSDSIPPSTCHSWVWLLPNNKGIRWVKAKCELQPARTKRSADIKPGSLEDSKIEQLVQDSIDKLEMETMHRYKQRVVQINSYTTKITTGKVTTIDFDVGYTSCLKYEWVDNVTRCEFLEHLPRRHCISNIYERLWIDNGKNIDVNCEDDETPLEAHIEFESAETATLLANVALKHIEAKYPHPRKQKVVRIFSLEKQQIAGLHYRLKLEIGFTNCVALTTRTDCALVNDMGLNKFCRVNVWIRPWTEHPPNIRVTCDYQDSATGEIYHQIQAEHIFYDFITTYKPSYSNDHKEMGRRFEIFRDNIRKIHELNTHEQGTATYAVTRFTDLTYEEFSKKYLGLRPDLQNPNQIPMMPARIPSIDVPEAFDWRQYDAVTEVKDQGSCGSCWAFSVTGNIEGQYKIQSGKLVSLSEQELVDCDKLDSGCNGGLPDNAYRAIEQLGGLELETDYPYDGEDEKCVFNKTLSRVQISGAVNISSNESSMAQWLVKNGPLSIGINANAMQFYMGGVSHPWKMLCNPKNLDHGVLIVGYGVSDYPLFHKKLPYWIVKNSWGKLWGEQGYYRVYRGDGTCGLNQMVSSAIVSGVEDFATTNEV